MWQALARLQLLHAAAIVACSFAINHAAPQRRYVGSIASPARFNACVGGQGAPLHTLEAQAHMASRVAPLHVTLPVVVVSSRIWLRCMGNQRWLHVRLQAWHQLT
jgi:hypothetical protein